MSELYDRPLTILKAGAKAALCGRFPQALESAFVFPPGGSCSGLRRGRRATGPYSDELRAAASAHRAEGVAFRIGLRLNKEWPDPDNGGTVSGEKDAVLVCVQHKSLPSPILLAAACIEEYHLTDPASLPEGIAPKPPAIRMSGWIDASESDVPSEYRSLLP